MRGGGQERVCDGGIRRGVVVRGKEEVAREESQKAGGKKGSEAGGLGPRTQPGGWSRVESTEGGGVVTPGG